MNLIEIIELPGSLMPLETYYQTIDRITPAAIQAAAQKYFVTAHRTVGTLSSGAK